MIGTEDAMLRLRPIWGEDRRDDAPSPTDASVLPVEFPVFPLSQALLLPRARLPLNIFEPRYLNMVESALGRGRMFGMIQPGSRKGDAVVGRDARPVASLQRVGCLGRLSSFAETEDGCFVVTLAGLARFDVEAELPVERGFRSVRASFARWAGDLAPSPPVGLDRAPLLDALRRYFRARGLDANWDAVEQMEDDQLVDTLCVACPFSDGEKQALLESPDPMSRARDLTTLLEIGLHETNGKDRPRHAS